MTAHTQGSSYQYQTVVLLQSAGILSTVSIQILTEAISPLVNLRFQKLLRNLYLVAIVTGLPTLQEVLWDRRGRDAASLPVASNQAAFHRDGVKNAIHKAERWKRMG